MFSSVIFLLQVAPLQIRQKDFNFEITCTELNKKKIASTLHEIFRSPLFEMLF